MPYVLSMKVQLADGTVTEIQHERDTERACDEAQLMELPKLEAKGARLISAGIVRERSRDKVTREVKRNLNLTDE